MGSERDRDVSAQTEIFQDLLDDAAFLWTQREQGLAAPDLKLQELMEGCESRLLAHLDALVLGGDPVAEAILLPALASEEAETVACAALALLSQEGEAGLEAVFGALARAAEEARRGVARALSLTYRADVGPRLARLLAAAPPGLSEVILEVLGSRGQDPGLPLDGFLSSDSLDVQLAALRAARRFPWRVDARSVEEGIYSAESAVRQAALETGLVLGLEAAWPACMEMAQERDLGWGKAALLLGMGGEPSEAPLLFEALREPALRAETIQALGFHGRREAADTLLELMADEELAPLAGEAFSTITGLVLEDRLLASPKDSPEDETPAEDVLPRPQVDEVSSWWARARRSFEPQRRYLMGRPFGWEVLRQALAEGPMLRRPVLALELAIRSRGACQLVTEDWCHRQSRQLLSTPALSTSRVTKPFRMLPAPAPPRAPPPAPPREPAFQPVRSSRPAAARALAITGLGMVSSLGHGAAGSCAAARAGMSRPDGLEALRVVDPETNEDFPATGHPVPHLTRGFSGLGRLVRLGLAALGDLCHHVPLEAGPRTGLFLNLPSGYFLSEAERQRWTQAQPDEPLPPEPSRADVLRESYSRALAPRLSARIPGGCVHEEIFFEDSPGLVLALRAARRGLKERRLDRCIVGCIDSLVDAEVLEAMGELDVLKTPANPVGLMPGEGAAFVLIESLASARRRAAPVQAVIDDMVVATEPFALLSPQPNLGVALASAVGELLGRLEDGGRETGLVIGDLNGTEARASDWGYSLVRLRDANLNEAMDWHPALSFGDVGAATGAFGVCMAARGFARGHAPSPNVLLWLWGNRGTRGAVYIRAPPEP